MGLEDFKEQEHKLLKDVKKIYEKEKVINQTKIEERENTGQVPDQELVDKDKFLMDQIFSKESQIIQGESELIKQDILDKYNDNKGELSNDNEEIELC